MVLWNCVIYSKKKSRFIQNQEASKLGIRTTLRNIPLIGGFSKTIFEVISLKWIKSSTWFLLAGDKFIPKLHL